MEHRSSHHRHALDSDDEDSDDDDEDDEDEMDPTLLANTEANAGKHSATEYLLAQPALLTHQDGESALDGPNLVKQPASPFAMSSSSTSTRTSGSTVNPSAYTTPPPSTVPPSSLADAPAMPGRMRRRKSTLKS